ncbi:MAG: hypothetical protein A2Y78_06585 [Acidobacteria bacterium RBG_13_68_16]|nr:MAG: hypothetical protein A2Y78_06585 [Acidobacteria bacterium RBG_13_68_16]
MGFEGREKRKATVQSRPVSLVATSWPDVSQPNVTKWDPVHTAVVMRIELLGASQRHWAGAAPAIRQAQPKHTALSADLISEQ